MTQPPPNLPLDEIPIRPRRIRAPQGDAQALIEPRLTLDLIDENRKTLKGTKLTFGDTAFAEMRDQARLQLLRAALAYTGAYRDHTYLHIPWRQCPKLFVSGHQPELFHPGVWLKNFYLSLVGGIPSSVGINLTIDNDTAGSASIRIPAGSLSQPRAEEFAIDAPFENVPFEERPVVSTSALKQFATRLRNQFNPADWFFDNNSPALLADRLSPHLELSRAGNAEIPLGETLARARHRLEQDLDLQTLELPLSAIAQTDNFRLFALHLVRNADRLCEIYNRSLVEYRNVNKIRSTSHPVPALAIDGEWREVPFWIWTATKPFRKRLFARNVFVTSGGAFIELSDRDSIHLELHSSNHNDETLAQQLREHELRGVKIRPRALITTMYARLFLSDLFIHGIGGAKYDELTDAIIRRFFGIEPPAYMTVTGTVRLPINRPTTTEADVRQVKQLIREIRFQPEKFVNDVSPAIRESASQFAAQKTALLREHHYQFRRASPEQFRAIDELNRKLSLLLTDVEIRLRDELKVRERDYQTNRLLGSREFSFVLHLAETLPDQLKRMASGL